MPAPICKITALCVNMFLNYIRGQVDSVIRGRIKRGRAQHMDSEYLKWL